ncbi:MAG: GerW family sporulation protein [Clostridiales bacterium]
MEQHPIEGLMRTALENIKDMVDVSTVVGDPIDNGSGIFMVPICKVSCGFVSGGSEFGSLEIGGSGNNGNGGGKSQQKESNPQAPANSASGSSANVKPTFPFGGGSGAGVGITPIGFLVVQGDQVRLVTLDSTVNLVERVADLTPKAIEKLKQVLSKKAPAPSDAGSTATNLSGIDI